VQAWLLDLVAGARAGRAPDLAGTRLAGSFAVSDELVTRAAAEQLAGASGRVREVRVRSTDGRALVEVGLKPAFLPAIRATVEIDRQPRLPADPVLVLKWSMLGAAGLLAGRLAGLFGVLPPGVRLAGDRLFVDLAVLLAQQGRAAVLPWIRTVGVSFEEGRIVLHADVHVEPPKPEPRNPFLDPPGRP
jgi:hypothetical protein